MEAVAELVMKRAISRKHDQSDEELMDELQMDLVEDVLAPIRSSWSSFGVSLVSNGLQKPSVGH